MSPSRKKARRILVLLALSGSLLPSCLGGSERSAHLSASAHNNIVAFVDFPWDKNPPTCYFPRTKEGPFLDSQKRVLEALKDVSFQEASKNFSVTTESAFSYGRLSNAEPLFVFRLSVTHTCACVGTYRDLGLDANYIERFYSLDQIDGDAIYAAAVTLKAEQESSVSKASSSSGKGGSASV